MEHQPMPPHQPSKADVFFKYVKNIFILLIVLQFAPMVLSGLKKIIEDNLFPKVHIGLINISGVLSNATYYEKKIEKFAKSPDIKGIILKIDSPGGLPGTAQAIFNALKKCKEKKPVVTVVENVCASASYYAALASNMIICNPSSLIGSIGVLVALPNVKHLLNNWKIRFDYLQSGSYKTAGSPLKDATEEELTYLQGQADDIYQQFIKDVATCRKISPKDFTVWADGKVFTGNQALKLKLVDKLGSFYDGVSEMKHLLELDEETEIKLIKPTQASSLMRLLGADEEYGIDAHSSLADRFACFASDVYHKFLMHQKNSQPTLQ
jgi:protease-4